MTTPAADAVGDAFPSAKALQDAVKLEVLDDSGSQVSFGSVLNESERTVVVFIREFLSHFDFHRRPLFTWTQVISFVRCAFSFLQ